MKTLLIVFVVTASLMYMGCQPNSKQQERVQEHKVTPPPPDVSRIIASVSELQEEKMFLVTLKFKKEQLTIDPFDLIGNEIKAEHKTIVVGEETYNSYQVGQKISEQTDTWGIFFEGDFSTYVIKVDKKETESQFFWTDLSGMQTEINEAEYQEALRELNKIGRTITRVKYSGLEKNYLSNIPISEMRFASYKPLYHYYFEIEVKNETFTFDIGKQIRNASNVHKISLEVSENSYLSTREIWDPSFNSGSFFFKGRLSRLKGKVLRKWKSTDSVYQIGITQEQKEFIVAK